MNKRLLIIEFTPGKSTAPRLIKNVSPDNFYKARKFGASYFQVSEDKIWYSKKYIVNNGEIEVHYTVFRKSYLKYIKKYSLTPAGKENR